jgi:hypothetical protein
MCGGWDRQLVSMAVVGLWAFCAINHLFPYNIIITTIVYIIGTGVHVLVYWDGQYVVGFDRGLSSYSALWGEISVKITQWFPPYCFSLLFRTHNSVTLVLPILIHKYFTSA